jgi:hypothetical protein
MRVIAAGTGPVRQAPFPDGPTAEVLVDDQAGAGQLATARVKVAPGAVVLLDQGERVRLANHASQPVSLLAVFPPAGFVRVLASWPCMTGTAGQARG